MDSVVQIVEKNISIVEIWDVILNMSAVHPADFLVQFVVEDFHRLVI